MAGTFLTKKKDTLAYERRDKLRNIGLSRDAHVI
jgi:hypothetical protein